MHHRPHHPVARPAARRRAGRPLLVALALLVVMAPLCAAQADLSVPPYDLLVSPGASPDQRVAAATEILQDPRPAVALTEALALLSSDPTGGEAARGVLQALSRVVQAPHTALAPTLAIARDPTNPLQTDAIRALRAFRTREAAAALVDLTSDAQQPTVRESACRSLARLTGRDDLGMDPAAWRAWLAGVLSLSERQWEQELLVGHVRQSQRLEAAVGESERRLVEAWRQIHLLTPAEARSAVLVRLLGSDLPLLRDLGFELVNRELSESRVLESSVADAAIGLLGSPDPLVRAQAALLLNRLVPANAEPAVLAALARESDPRAADALLLAASRWPSPAAVQPMLRWFGGNATLRMRAAGLAWTLLRAGYLERPEDRAAVLDALRPVEATALTSSACRLLASLGGEPELAKVRSLLHPDVEPALRATAADAMGLREDELTFLLAAANDDAAIFEPVARAVRTHMHDARGYAILSRLPAPSAQVRARVLADYASSLSTAELVRLAKLAPEPAEALPLLTPLSSADRLSSAQEAPLLAEGLLLLAKAQLELGNPAEALGALSLIPQGQTPAPAQEITDLRATLLLRLNRIDEAEELEASADAWLDALERSMTEPYAPLIAERLETVFGDRLTAAHRDRLARLRRELANAESRSPDEGG